MFATTVIQLLPSRPAQPPDYLDDLDVHPLETVVPGICKKLHDLSEYAPTMVQFGRMNVAEGRQTEVRAPVPQTQGAGSEQPASILHVMPANREVEIKFRVEDVELLRDRLQRLGFRLVTDRTHEMNTLYDLPNGWLRRRGALLRMRKYGHQWTVTYKDRGHIGPGRHKTRHEIETPVEDGQALAEILEGLGFKPSFAYEKFRSEWTDAPPLPSGLKPGIPGEATGKGHVVIDETPIGNFAEIEGPAQWIDRVARQLEISKAQYITASYAGLFLQWKKRTGSKVTEMRFPP